MGTWGTGIYSGDFAADLRSTIAAAVRLPFDDDRLVDVICESACGVANDPGDLEYTTFWLVLADQFLKRQIVSQRVREVVLGIIDSGQDIEMLKRLGMSSAKLAKRTRSLEELRQKLAGQVGTSKVRRTLREPQPLLLEVGDVLAYPTCQGKCINPYFSEKNWTSTGWILDGWSAMAVIESGHAFDFLAWYRPIRVVNSWPQMPANDIVDSKVTWVLRNPGTSTKQHFKRMRFQKISHITVDEARLRKAFPNMPSGTDAAIHDISIANQLSVGPNRDSSLDANSDLKANATILAPSIDSLSEITLGRSSE